MAEKEGLIWVVFVKQIATGFKEFIFWPQHGEATKKSKNVRCLKILNRLVSSSSAVNIQTFLPRRHETTKIYKKYEPNAEAQQTQRKDGS